jgi:hypothetical protein
LLGLSCDAANFPELRPDYTISQSILARKLIEFAYPTAIVDAKVDAGGEVHFEVEGLLLGSISGKSSGGGSRAWGINMLKSKLPDAVFNTRVSETFSEEGKRSGWCIPMTNERRLGFGRAVVLLRGATRPSVLEYKNGRYSVDMLATPNQLGISSRLLRKNPECQSGLMCSISYLMRQIT